mmetsp:Transcript_3578/g.11031  ORF Transcript_3578/g.11031 Transcript_3578/m.11031 type:complete len:298 (+) Transcript_3578:1035-1928(+)
MRWTLRGGGHRFRRLSEQEQIELGHRPDAHEGRHLHPTRNHSRAHGRGRRVNERDRRVAWLDPRPVESAQVETKMALALGDRYIAMPRVDDEVMAIDASGEAHTWCWHERPACGGSDCSRCLGAPGTRLIVAAPSEGLQTQNVRLKVRQLARRERKRVRTGAAKNDHGLLASCWACAEGGRCVERAPARYWTRGGHAFPMPRLNVEDVHKIYIFPVRDVLELGVRAKRVTAKNCDLGPIGKRDGSMVPHCTRCITVRFDLLPANEGAIQLAKLEDEKLTQPAWDGLAPPKVIFLIAV